MAQVHAKIKGFEPAETQVDVEHINAIGHSLSDLTERTLALRGFL